MGPKKIIPKKSLWMITEFTCPTAHGTHFVSGVGFLGLVLGLLVSSIRRCKYRRNPSDYTCAIIAAGLSQFLESSCGHLKALVDTIFSLMRTTSNPSFLELILKLLIMSEASAHAIEHHEPVTSTGIPNKESPHVGFSWF